MKGLIITNLYPSSNKPTRATFNYQQFEHLSTYCELLIIVPVFPNEWKYLSDNSEFEMSKNNRVHYLAVPTIPKFGKYFNAKILYLTLMLKKKKIIKDFSPSFILGCFAYPDGVAASSLASKLKLPCFMKVHGTDINVMAKSPAIRKQLVRALKNINTVFSVSESLANNIVNLNYDRKKISVIYNGINHKKFRLSDKIEARNYLELDTNAPIILFIGNILVSKGAVDLASAFSKLNHKANLIYIGSGSAINKINDIANNLENGSSISIIEPQHHDVIPKWLAACDILALPSHNEGVPNVILEAMACGRPCVATKVGGIPEILPSNSGIIVEKGAIKDLTDALMTALKTEWDPQIISSNAKNFDWTINASQLFKRIYDEI